MNGLKLGRFLVVIGILLGAAILPGITVGLNNDSQDDTPPPEETIDVKCSVFLDGQIFHKSTQIPLTQLPGLRLQLLKAVLSFVMLYGLGAIRGDTVGVIPGMEEKKILAINTLENMLGGFVTQGFFPPGLGGLTLNDIGLLPSMGFSFMQPVLSFGYGKGFVPRYQGEAALGIVLRPIILEHVYGYTGSLNARLLPPRIEYWDRIGAQYLVAAGFIGIYVNFGEIGYGTVPTQLLLGECLFFKGEKFLNIANPIPSFPSNYYSPFNNYYSPFNIQ